MLNLTQNNAEPKNKVKLLYVKESYLIRGACFELYKELGSGHKEIVYQRGLEEKLKTKGLIINSQEQIPIFVNGKKVGSYIPDLVVNNIIMIELKASPVITLQDTRQFWQYLHITPYKLGFLINFGKSGGIQIIRRIYETARQK